MPNNANGVILNQVALVPAHQQIILSNSGVYCITQAIPAQVVKEEK